MFRSFEIAVSAPGSVAGCLEFPDRVIFTTQCGTSPGECRSRKCNGCKVIFKSYGNHTWCLPQYTHPNLYEVQQPVSNEVCGSNNLPSTLSAAWHYGYTAGVTSYQNFSNAARRTPEECAAFTPASSESRWFPAPMRVHVDNATLGPPQGVKPSQSALTFANARLPTSDRCWLDPYFDGGNGTCISITAEMHLSKSTAEMRSAWSCYSPYLRYLGISCPAGTENGFVSVETLQDAAMKAERLDEIYAKLADFLQNKTITPLSVFNRSHSRILQVCLQEKLFLCWPLSACPVSACFANMQYVPIRVFRNFLQKSTSDAAEVDCAIIHPRMLAHALWQIQREQYQNRRRKDNCQVTSKIQRAGAKMYPEQRWVNV